MNATTPDLEVRVAHLEQELRELKQLVISTSDKPNPKAWRQTLGMFKDDPIFDAIIQKGREYRESQPYPEDVEE